MEDELCYSSVMFKSFDNEKSTVPQLKESVLYGEVKRKQSTSQTPTETSAAECSVKESPLPAHGSLPEEKETSSQTSPAYRRATVFLGLLCFLLLAAVAAASVFSCIHMSKYNNILAQYTEERDANLQLLEDKEALEVKLMTLTEQINDTLVAILHKSSFVVGDFCQSSANGLRCSPCYKNWIQNGSSCYFFYMQHDWKAWGDSLTYCKGYGAQLAMIDSLEEQEFINQNTKTYYDKYHGYWIGLSRQPGKNWVWTTGANLSTQFWINSGTDNCVLSMPSNKTLSSWNSASCTMFNRWICEMEALPWPTFLLQ